MRCAGLRLLIGFWNTIAIVDEEAAQPARLHRRDVLTEARCGRR